jgi:hypothetical protein
VPPQPARDFLRWRVGSVVVGPMPNRAVMAGVYLWRNPKVAPVRNPPAEEPA